jgi:hypothetical protein
MCFQCQFFVDISEEIGEIPVYVSHALFLLGYDSRGTFKQCADRNGKADLAKVEQVITNVQEKIIEIFNSKEYENDEFYKQIIDNIAKYRMKVNANFKILPGHKALIVSVVEQSVKEVTVFPQVVAKRVKMKDREEKKLMEKYEMKGESVLQSVNYNGVRIREFRIIKQANDYAFECPYCMLCIKISCGAKTCFNNFERHLTIGHVKKPLMVGEENEQTEVQLVEVETTPDDAVLVDFEEPETGVNEENEKTASRDNLPPKTSEEQHSLQPIVLSSTTTTTESSSDSPSAKVRVAQVPDKHARIKTVSDITFVYLNYANITLLYLEETGQKYWPSNAKAY